MKDSKGWVERFRVEAEECRLISKLATNQAKRDTFARLAAEAQASQRIGGTYCPPEICQQMMIGPPPDPRPITQPARIADWNEHEWPESGINPASLVFDAVRPGLTSLLIPGTERALSLGTNSRAQR